VTTRAERAEDQASTIELASKIRFETLATG